MTLDPHVGIIEVQLRLGEMLDHASFRSNVQEESLLSFQISEATGRSNVVVPQHAILDRVQGNRLEDDHVHTSSSVLGLIDELFHHQVELNFVLVWWDDVVERV